MNSSAPATKRKIALGVGAAVLVAIVALALRPGDSTDYHVAEFRAVQAGFNTYSPSLLDRFRGIRNNQQKLDFHLNRLISMGAVERRELVFTEVRHTAESSQRLWRLAMTGFPEVVDLRSEHLSTKAPGYGAKPYRLEVFDVPEKMSQWVRFLEANNKNESGFRSSNPLLGAAVEAGLVENALV